MTSHPPDGRLAAQHLATRSVLLHGDLHHDSVLRADRGPIAIDPHGYVGDPGYDAVQLLFNPHFLVAELDDAELGALTTRRLGRLSALLSADRARLGAWAYLKAVASQVWLLEDEQPYGVSYRFARALEPRHRALEQSGCR